ncbi:MAG: VacJ family lipoprotein [Desulfobulbaceae bacterium]|nr:VacJ family lipoprotein [Desulfobulbaceae bacterium]HIJ79622.1 VacJ family lipoprotein [Deltaproteobacteria bacterium]
MSSMVFAGVTSFDDDAALDGEVAAVAISDPLEPINRAFFQFNDKLYFWVVKPVAQGYSYFLAEDVRICVRDFFHNLLAPVRIVNSLLQGKVKSSGIETARFLINSTVGIAGLADPARREFGLAIQDEDLGQTLGVYGVGEGIYLCWPFFGPSNVRDTVGLVGDAFLSPMTYITSSDFGAGVGAKAGSSVNDVSLTIGDYETFKASAIDPYIALRDAYFQYRRKEIRDDSGVKESLYLSRVENGAVQESGGAEVEALQGQEASADSFFVQIGTTVDIEVAMNMQEQLRMLHRVSLVKVYDRGAYKYYGVRVPAGKIFETAKKEEQKLCALGFVESRVVQ